MPLNLNSTNLAGRIGKNPELKTVGNGKSVCKFSLATNDYGKTNWHQIELWNQPAEFASRYLKKGDEVIVSGSIDYQDWTDRDGNKRISTVIKGFSISAVSNGGNKQDSEPANKSQNETIDEDADDIPF